MRKNNVFPILLAGGIGSRLWPISRKNYPKQFSKFFDKQKSFFQNTILGLRDCPELKLNNSTIFTNTEHRFIVEEQIREVSQNNLEILLEPSSKNTAPSILSAALHILDKNIDGIMVILPTDHYIKDHNSFFNTIMQAVDCLQKEFLMTLGVTPDRPETGYGYLELQYKNSGKTNLVSKFIEKPSLDIAQKMLDSGNFLWNSGVFISYASDIKNFFLEHSNFLFKDVQRAYEKKSRDLNFINLHKASWNKCASISFDYAVVEKLKKIQTTEFSGFWDDMGSWEAYWRHKNKNEKNTFTQGLVFESQCKDSLIIAEGENIPVVASGLENTTVVVTEDGVLVSKQNSLKNFSSFLSAFKDKKLYQGESFNLVFRPWGQYETLIKKDKYHVKKIHVKPKARLSLQSHVHRSEHWVVVEGKATVTLGSKKKTVTENESIYVAVGSKHRIENKENTPLIIIEVQIGRYLEEDDIIRYEDDYDRVL